VNKILARYNNGWEMKSDFEIVELAPIGLGELLTADLPANTDNDSRERVKRAVEKYRKRSSSRHDRRDAVIELAGALEPLREKAKSYLGSKDENQLFDILNNFGIRHNNKRQKEDYDPIWLSALFYHSLTMIHLIGHLSQKRSLEQQASKA
jgi:hypothetical protein